MGKSLIINGADFSANAIQSLISTSQTSAGDYYSPTTGELVNVGGNHSVLSISKISCLNAKQIFILKTNATNKQPNGIVFWAGDTFLGLSPAGATQELVDVGSVVFEVPTGATHFSYVFQNTYAPSNWTIGLASEIYAIY